MTFQGLQTFLTLLPPAFSAALLLALAVLLLRGSFRQYPFLLAYCGTELAISLGEGFAFHSAGVKSALYRYVYWGGDVLHDLMLFLLVMTLTYKTLEGSPMRPATGRLLKIIAVAAVALPFVIYHPYFNSRWFRHTSQLLSLGAAIMNLLLWTAIIGKKKRDPQLLMVSAGVGIAVTGLAIYYGMLQFMSSDSTHLAPDLFHGLTHVAGNAIWVWAFRPSFGRRAASPSAGQPVVGQV
jgi:hypothetical protein